MVRTSSWAGLLWGKQAHVWYLITAAGFLLFVSLGVREIWTQEHRWVDVVAGMFASHDFLHPMLNGNEYYDKPLLSYWLIAAMVAIAGKMALWAVRFPSAVAGLIAIGSIYRIGYFLRGKALGALAGWLLLTCFYFLFWARVSSTDMLNLAGALLAIAWYFSKSQHASWLDYVIFFLIVAFTALCKGLVAPAIVFLTVLPAMVLQRTGKRHLLNWQLYIATVPALLLYLLPFGLSTLWHSDSYHSNGLSVMFRENVVRYFQPFDHQEPFYMYFLYLPVYLLPWTFLFMAAFFSSLRRGRQTLSWQRRWMLASIFLLMLFFMCCGSRRAYYVLPILPFAILLTADWILSASERWPRLTVWTGRWVVLFYILFAVDHAVLQPLYYHKGGLATFANVVNHEASKIRPWSAWRFSLLDAQTKVNFYLNLSPRIVNYGIKGLREQQTIETLRKTWPTIKNIPADTIFITRRLYEPVLNPILKNYRLVEAEPTYMEWFLKRPDPDAPVAYVPVGVRT